MSVIVLGDPMIDIWWSLSTVPRVNPESSTAPILKPVSESVQCPGGALNVAANIERSFFMPTQLLSSQGIEMLQRFARVTHIPPVSPSGVHIITKFRLLRDGVLFARIDNDVPYVSARLDRFQRAELRDAQVIVIVDYGKGSVTTDFVYDVLETNETAYVIIDAKPKLHRGLLLNHQLLARRVILRANAKEVEAVGFTNASEWRWATNAHAAIITRGSEGVEYALEDRHRVEPLAFAPGYKTMSTVGAGDVFTGALAEGLSKQYDLETSIIAAMHTATSAAASQSYTLRV